MRLVSYSYEGVAAVGVMASEGDVIIPAAALGFAAAEMQELIRELNEEKLQKLPAMLQGKSGLKLSDVKLFAPIRFPEHDVICLGLNYKEHADEAAKADSGYDQQRGDAVYFGKRVNEAVAPGDPIDGNLNIVTQLDYEVELAVILGKDAKNVSEKDAMDYVLGYTILNDVSARNLQLKHKQWYFGKCLDGFTPIGPWIVTKDEIPGNPVLGIRCYVNGELRQNSDTGKLIFDIPYCIAELSAGMTLQAGTIISTGTPSGVALGMAQPKYLNKGDVVRCEIDKIGTLENTIA